MAEEGQCIFCAIAREKQQADVVYRDERVVIFRDIKPKYRVHLLAIPTQHLTTSAWGRAHAELIGYLFTTAARIAREQGLEESGFRLVVNHGRHAGQEIAHLHVHILGGEPLHPL
jgi:histidine triad (HIT) family protein